jgi:hypothetical protein
MSGEMQPPGSGEGSAEAALGELEQLAGSDEEDHEARLEALDRLHTELEAELEERGSESPPHQ